MCSTSGKQSAPPETVPTSDHVPGAARPGRQSPSHSGVLRWLLEHGHSSVLLFLAGTEPETNFLITLLQFHVVEIGQKHLPDVLWLWQSRVLTM